MDDLYGTILDLPPRAKTLIAFLIGFILIDDLEADQQIAIGNLFVMAGQTLITNGTEQRLVELAKIESDQQHVSNTLTNFNRRLSALEDVEK
jgi:hypothetical protein